MRHGDGTEAERSSGEVRRGRVRRVVAAAVVTASTIVGCQSEEPPNTEPAETATTVAVATTTALTEPAIRVAEAFLDAYGSFDIEAASSYLSDLADLSRIEGGARLWKLGNQWLEAQGFQLILETCEETDTSLLGVSVRCAFDFHAIGSDALGVGPFSGSYFDITVQDNEINSVAMTWAFIENGFSNTVWEPFARWVSENHPEDAKVMYTDDSFNLEALTEEAIRLWEQNSKEYVASITEG